MPLLYFILILSALVIVHELGHMSVAKYFGIRVDEFGLGYPPRAKKLFNWKGTDFTVNWLPLGGFVKIFGENYAEGDQLEAGSFQSKNRGIQAAVLVAGVVGNFLFAWLLFSIGFLTGIPAPVGLDLPVTNPRTTITLVMPDSPAQLAGLKSGDVILYYSPEEAAELISSSKGPLTLSIDRGGKIAPYTVTPETGILKDQKAVGISMELVGTVRLPFLQAISEGWKSTAYLTWATAQALGKFILEGIVGRADLSGVTGPVGLVGMVGDVSALGFGHLITFTALISINLAIINLMPFPALDGGRLVLVAVEASTRRRIPPRIFNALNTLGFVLLVFLMLLVTVRDVGKLF